MVPHSLFVSSDRHVDIALNVLTAIVSAALIASLAWVLYTGLTSATVADRGDVGPPAWASSVTELLGPVRAEFDRAVPALTSIYRCEQLGQVTYSDRPCTGARTRSSSFRAY